MPEGKDADITSVISAMIHLRVLIETRRYGISVRNMPAIGDIDHE